jgi:hypothetical protein
MADLNDQISDLWRAVEQMHDCQATFLEEAVVNEWFQGKPVWQGIVHIFELTGHPTASRCYAWSFPIGESDKRRFFAVLHVPPITSAQHAVRAGIVQEYRTDPHRRGE